MIRHLVAAALLVVTSSCGSAEIQIECADTETLSLAETDLGPNGKLFAAKACRCDDYLQENEADCDLAAGGRHCVPESEDPAIAEKRFEEFLARPDIAGGNEDAFCRAVGTGK